MNTTISEHVMHLKRIRSGLDFLAGMIEDKIVTGTRLTEDDNHGLLALLQSLAPDAWTLRRIGSRTSFPG